jgi:subfamily B ATP-binding cassette protein HlyB/CyaB
LTGKSSIDRPGATRCPLHLAAARAPEVIAIAARVEGAAIDGARHAALGFTRTRIALASDARWTGELILMTMRERMVGAKRPFDLTWFIPSIVRFRKLLGEALVGSLFLQPFALITPLFTQVVIDKVLVHKGWSTLDVLVFGLVVISVFEIVLGGLRSYVLAHTTNRIDVELGARLFRHLVSLPLGYFGVRRVGDSVARVRELENIRQFLTGQALTIGIDVAFASVFVVVMWLYSWQLTVMVLAAIPVWALIVIVATPSPSPASARSTAR